VDAYPKVDDRPWGISPWFKVEGKDLYHRGLEVFLSVQDLVIDGSVARHAKESEDTELTKMFVVGQIPFDAIVTIDWEGDEYYSMPHVYCWFDQADGPYEAIVLYERGYEDHLFLRDDADRVRPVVAPGRARVRCARARPVGADLPGVARVVSRSGRRSGMTVLTVLAAAVLAHAPDAWAQPGCDGSHWVGAWTTSPAYQRPEGFQGQTLRMIVTPHRGGSATRVRLTNRFGDRPVRFEHAHVALRQSGAELVPGSGRRLTFRGRQEVTIAPGASTVSDPVQLGFAAFQDLAVSLYAERATGPTTEHVVARQTSFLTAPGEGDHAADESPEAFSATTTAWSFLEAVEVGAPKRVGTVVALGDSITDGYQRRAFPVGENAGGIDLNERYPDFLARRLLDARGPNAPSVLNAGISGNRVLRDGVTDQGRSALARVDADVLAAAGVTDVILLEGINDLGQTPRATPGELIEGLRQLVRRLRAAKLNVLLGTLTPAGGTRRRKANAGRKLVNEWIRTSGVPAVDFDAAVRDPADPSRLQPEYDSGDHLHPNSAGYRAMADAVDLSALRGTPCAANRWRRRTALSVSVRPRRDRRLPYSLRIRGRLRPVGGGPCPPAFVRLPVTNGGRLVASRSVRLRPNCRFTLNLAIRGRHPPGDSRRLLIRARFNGTRTLRPATARAVVHVR